MRKGGVWMICCSLGKVLVCMSCAKGNSSSTIKRKNILSIKLKLKDHFDLLLVLNAITGNQLIDNLKHID